MEGVRLFPGPLWLRAWCTAFGCLDIILCSSVYVKISYFNFCKLCFWYVVYSEFIKTCIYLQGANSYGQLFLGNTDDQLLPAVVTSVKKASDIVPGGTHTFFDGLRCFVNLKLNEHPSYRLFFFLSVGESNWVSCGTNSHGQLGVDASKTNEIHPVPVWCNIVLLLVIFACIGYPRI